MRLNRLGEQSFKQKLLVQNEYLFLQNSTQEEKHPIQQYAEYSGSSILLVK